MQEMQVRSLSREDPLEKGMATHSNILAWKIPWTEEPDSLQSMGLQRVGHDSVTEHNSTGHGYHTKTFGAVEGISTLQLPSEMDLTILSKTRSRCCPLQTP